MTVVKMVFDFFVWGVVGWRLAVGREQIGGAAPICPLRPRGYVPVCKIDVYDNTVDHRMWITLWSNNSKTLKMYNLCNEQ